MKKKKLTYASMSKNEKILGSIWLVLQLGLPWVMNWLNGLLTTPLSSGVLTFATYSLHFLVVVSIFHSFLRNSITAAWHDLWNLVQATVLGFVAHWVCVRVLDRLLGLIIPGYAPILDASLSQLAASNVYLRIVGVVILAPVIEEILYRGLVYRNLWRKSRAAAYIVSMLVFALVHTLGHVGTGDLTTMLLCFARYLPAGLCLAWTYSKADNVFAPIVVHAVINAITIGIV